MRAMLLDGRRWLWYLMRGRRLWLVLRRRRKTWPALATSAGHDAAKEIAGAMAYRRRGRLRQWSVMGWTPHVSLLRGAAASFQFVAQTRNFTVIPEQTISVDDRVAHIGHLERTMCDNGSWLSPASRTSV